LFTADTVAEHVDCAPDPFGDVRHGRRILGRIVVLVASP
jgi:hypothetical protein